MTLNQQTTTNNQQLNSHTIIGIVGSGAMGNGIAQVAANAGHKVLVYDNNKIALDKAKASLEGTLKKLVEKQKFTEQQAKDILSRTTYTDNLNSFSACGLVIEAIIENLEVKQKLFSELEKIVVKEAILASNTSSLSIASIASSCGFPDRVVGIHFFNPAPLMPLVEIIPAITTKAEIANDAKKLIDTWGKVTVLAKDTPGFIVNRVARPFYSESIRIFEEGIADLATIDWAMKEFGGFKMGPFELMDFIGNDINYKVTESVWEQFFYEPRFKPSLTQKRLYEAKLFGKKTGKGYYNYAEGSTLPEPKKDKELGENICWRVLVMLINEATDSLYLGLASRDDIDMAMMKGVNYPKGLLKWADEKGIEDCLNAMEKLYAEYGEDRYRPSILLKKMVREKRNFYQ